MIVLVVCANSPDVAVGPPSGTIFAALIGPAGMFEHCFPPAAALELAVPAAVVAAALLVPVDDFELLLHADKTIASAATTTTAMDARCRYDRIDPICVILPA